MIKALVSDFSETLLFPKRPEYHHNLNGAHRQLTAKFGEYNAWDHFLLNEELLEFYASLKPRYPLYLFTTDEVQNQRQIRQRLDAVFTKIFSAKAHGISKRDPAAYTYIAKDISVAPQNILYIDDRDINLIPAMQAGLNTLLYLDNQSVRQQILQLLN